MTRTDILWAASSSATGRGSPANLLDQPDAHTYVISDDNPSATVRDFRRMSHPSLADLLGASVAGDVVTPIMLANADIIAFEHNGTLPAAGGGWESCKWQFSDGQESLLIDWNAAIVDGLPVPRDPHVVANGSITGAAFGVFFDIPESAILAENPAAQTPEDVVISFLLFRLTPEIDVRSPSFEVTLSVAAGTPDVDAIGVLAHSTDLDTTDNPGFSSWEPAKWRRKTLPPLPTDTPLRAAPRRRA